MRKQRWSVAERQSFQDGDRLKASSVPGKTPSGPLEADWGLEADRWKAGLVAGWEDSFDDWGDEADVPLVCGIENPEQCESCT